MIVLSEYGCRRRQPVHLNRVFREAGWLSVRDELGTDAFDPGASQAFAVADHQVAHVHVRDATLVPAVRALLEGTPGVAEVLDRSAQAACGLDHERSGDLVAVASPMLVCTTTTGSVMTGHPTCADRGHPRKPDTTLRTSSSLRVVDAKAEGGRDAGAESLASLPDELISLDASLVRGSPFPSPSLADARSARRSCCRRRLD